MAVRGRQEGRNLRPDSILPKAKRDEIAAKLRAEAEKHEETLRLVRSRFAAGIKMFADAELKEAIEGCKDYEPALKGLIQTWMRYDLNYTRALQRSLKVCQDTIRLYEKILDVGAEVLLG